jgi:hypothetical protein
MILIDSLQSVNEASVAVAVAPSREEILKKR